MKEIDKMKSGQWYDANYDQQLLDLRLKTQSLCVEYNTTRLDNPKSKQVLKEILHSDYEGLTIIPSFTCDYGTNITFGKNCFVNANCYFMDCASITIGDNVFFGPYTGLYTATHPLQAKYRNQGLEKALPIKIGNNCWFGANVSVMPGVTIGNGVVIGAGSVVTKDIEDNVVVAGVPAKVIKKIDQDADLED